MGYVDGTDCVLFRKGERVCSTWRRNEPVTTAGVTKGFNDCAVMVFYSPHLYTRLTRVLLGIA